MRFLILYIVFFFATLGVQAQSSQETFGKNRVQYKEFKWKYITTKHFNIYYYQEGANIAHNTARIAEEDFDKITSIIGYTPFSKITLMVYNSPGDLRQSNIGLQNIAFVGGETRLVKQKKELCFDGNYLEFRKKIGQTVADMLINSMLFGGSLKEVVQSSYLLHIPEWFVTGAGAYIGKGWDSEMDDAVRDLIVTNNFSPTGLIGDDAEIIGQSIWNYIAVTYGETTVSSILNLSRIVRNEEISIEHSIGQDYKEFLKDWHKFYREQIEIDTLATKPSWKLRTRKLNYRKYRYNDISFNRDSSVLAYTENFNARQRVVIYNTETGRKKLFWRRGTRIVDQEVDYGVPLVAWRSTHELSILTYRKGRPFLFTKNLQTGKKEKKYFNTFDQITSFDYNQTNNDMAITAYKNGQSDLYLYDYKEDRARRITKDLYDDEHVRYIPGTNDIVFSSNRINDTLRSDLGEYETITEDFNLFQYNTIDKPIKLDRLTNSISAEWRPTVTKNGDLYFLLMWNHQKQVFKLNPTDSSFEQITNYEANVQNFTVSPDGNQLAFIARNRGKQFVFVDSTFSILESVNTISQQDIKKPEVVPEIQSIEEKINEIDLSILTFSNDSIMNPLGVVESEKDKTPDFTIYGPFPPRLSLGVDYVVSALEIDPLRGSGLKFHTQLSDMMSDHRFNFDVFAVSNLKTSSFSAEYEYLKHRFDYRLKYDRISLSVAQGALFHDYTLNKIAPTVSFPFNESSRLSLISFYMNTRYTDLLATTLNDSVKHYLGYQIEYVFDNTMEHGLNMLDGTRIKVQLTTNNYYGKQFENDPNKRFFGLLPGSENKDFARFNIDFRKYFKIYKQMTFATRASFGEFLGSSKKNFIIGGVDNWLFQKYSNPTSSGQNPLSPQTFRDNSDLFFLDYATNLRGFRYNARFGHRYLLANSELRVPLAKMIHKGPIGSNFFRNLQFIGFYDVGTAWSQGNPFSTDNDINTQVIETPENPFKITVRNYQNPFLIGYGFGARSTVLGYYLKFDVAWGIEDFVNQGKEFYLSFGYDF